MALDPPAGAHVALVYVEARAIRWTYSGDGANPARPLPTRTFGFRVEPGETVQVFGDRELAWWRAVSTVAQAATLQILYGRLVGRFARGPF